MDGNTIQLIGVIATNAIFFLTVLWRVASWQSSMDERMKKIEEIVLGDGKGMEGCTKRHRELDAALREVPSRGSLGEAFDQIRTLERTAAEDRRKTAVDFEQIKGLLLSLVDKVDSLAESRSQGRTKTNPGFDPNKR